jgi:hypothetical protein
MRQAGEVNVRLTLGASEESGPSLNLASTLLIANEARSVVSA